MTHYPLPNGLLSDLDRFVNQAFKASSDECCGDGECATSVKKPIETQSSDAEGWKLRLELPGFRKDEVKISADADFLSVVAETDDEARSFLTKQVRRVRISDEVDPNGIKAKLENGILFLEISRRVKDEPVDIVIN